MIPGPSPQGARPPFPYIGIATAILMLHAILVAIFPPNPYRAALALAALFAMGYCALSLIVGREIRLSAAEILAFSTGLTIFITSLSALGVSILGIPITVIAVVIVGFPISLFAWLVQRPRGSPLAAFTDFTRVFFDFSDYSRVEKGATAVLFSGIIAALVIFISLALVHYPGELSPGMTILAPDGTTNISTRFVQRQPQDIIVSALGGSTAGAFSVRIRLIPTNATGNETFHAVFQTAPLRMDAFAEYDVSIILGPRETWSRLFAISIEQAGVFHLNFALLDATSAVVTENLLPVVVT